MPASNIIDRFAALDGVAIHVQQLRCAKVRNRNVSCLKCADACTSGCISLEEGELVIDESKCVGCGTCATVCPTCALEARNPSDAELLNQCLAARADDTVSIVCTPAMKALEGLVDTDACAAVVCCGRVDESLLLGLVVEGVSSVHVVCGDCSMCEQEHGLDTANMVLDTTQVLLDAWENTAKIDVCHELPSYLLADGVTADAAKAALQDYFSERRGNTPIAQLTAATAEETTSDSSDERSAIGTDEGKPVAAVFGGEHDDASFASKMHVMKDGTLPHFIPDRRERLLTCLAELGEPKAKSIKTRLWGCTVIDGVKCSSCQMCATFCPTGAISKFEDEDGTFGVNHYPGDCVKCRSCEDVCKEDAIMIMDDVPPSYLLEGTIHRYVMKPRAVELDDPHQIVNTMQQYIDFPIYER